MGFFTLAVWLNNTALFSAARVDIPCFSPIGGVHQTYSREGLTGESCTATRIYPPAHASLENTLPSIEAAFDNGADIVGFDIRPTGHFAVLQ